jgi:Ca-activated chloride channel family protein
MLSSMQMVAKDLKIQVEFNPERVYAYRLIGYENRALADVEFRDDVVDAGEVGAGHRVTALYELALSPDELPDGVEPVSGEDSDEPRQITEDELVLVKVRYKQVDASANDPADEVWQSLSPKQMGTPDQDLQWAGAVAAFAEILRNGTQADPTLIDQIEATITRQTDRDATRNEFVELFTQSRLLLGM